MTQEQFPWMTLLEQQPELGYYGYRGAWGGTPAQNRYYQNNYTQVFSEYLGRLGQQILGGQAPTLQWTDFLKEYPWIARYAALPPSFRGDYPGQVAPRARWLTY